VRIDTKERVADLFVDYGVEPDVLSPAMVANLPLWLVGHPRNGTGRLASWPAETGIMNAVALNDQ
jgi:hypothetical protein